MRFVSRNHVDDVLIKDSCDVLDVNHLKGVEVKEVKDIVEEQEAEWNDPLS